MHRYLFKDGHCGGADKRKTAKSLLPGYTDAATAVPLNKAVHRDQHGTYTK